MIPKNLKREHFIKAIEEIRRNGIRKGRQSSTYDLEFEGEYYPPKLVISIANRYANGEELDSNDFSGGEKTQAFATLRNAGFTIVGKIDPTLQLIRKYKRRIRKNHLAGEKYKWELLQKYGGRPDPTVEDFLSEILDIDFSNLSYHMSIAVLRELAKKKPEELRKIFTDLYDESVSLSDRITSTLQAFKKVYSQINKNPKDSHHQDERSLATYLTYHYPNKYSFYKSSFYTKYCDLLNISKAAKNKKYVHYLELIQTLVSDYIEKDHDLIDTVKEFIPEHYDGSNNMILAEDILYQMLDQKDQINYWIFQGNPDVFDSDKPLKENNLKSWTVTAHKDKISIGDKVILWITGKQAGCYALAEVKSEPYTTDRSGDPYIASWKVTPNTDLVVDLQITHNLASNPILKEDVSELKNLKVGYQGSNFQSNRDEYESFLELAESSSSSSFQDTLQLMDESKFGTYMEALKLIVQKHNLQAHDERISFTARPKKRMLNFIIGNRYALCLNQRKGNTLFGFITSDKKTQGAEEFRNYSGEVDAYYNMDVLLESHMPEVLNAIEVELNRKYKSPHKRYQNPEFSSYVFGQPVEEKSPMTKNLKSKNIILYGPPGTGKTYALKNEYFKYFTTEKAIKSREEFIHEQVKSLSWWEILALALLDLKRSKVSEIKSHELIMAKAKNSMSKNVGATLWNQLQLHTVDECEYVNVTNKASIQLFSKNQNSEWEILEQKVQEQSPELFAVKESIDNYTPTTEPMKRYEFTTFHQSYSYEDFIEGIKPAMGIDDGVNDPDPKIQYVIQPGVLRSIIDRALSDRKNDYALFIDEINRGNVANIFGELITLIEDDKRLGEPNYVPVKLPYSRIDFGVPSNLYIIGTMNTADRSVEALDTALRRRFSFIEMNPKPELLKDDQFKCKGIELDMMLSAMNARIEKLLDKDYRIGHAYFMNIKDKQEPLQDLKTIFENKILPLLQEYFYGDWGKIGLVLGPAFVEVDRSDASFLSIGTMNDYEEYAERVTYRFTSSDLWEMESFTSIYE